MMTIQKPKRMWQKKKDYNKKRLIRKIQRRNKTSFDDGKDKSYSDLKTNRPIIIGPGLLSVITPNPEKYKKGKYCFGDGSDDIREQIEKDFPSSKAFGTILPDYTVVSDPTFTRDKTGAGEIEYFDEPEIIYANGYRKTNPTKGPSLVYNPNSQTEEDVKLDLLHHYRKYDPVYQDLLKDYTNTQYPGQILYNSELGEYFRNLPKEQQTDENWNKLVKENLNSQYVIQGIDGSLRGLMASDKLRSMGRYPSRTVYERENLNTDAARRTYQNIVDYLTSERLPEVIVKPNYQHGKNKGDNKQNWFTRMAIGAAFNENPAVMTAAGWHKDSRGNWKQKRTAATNKLADNLETISMMADGTGSIDLIKSAGKLLWNAIRHPVRTAKQVKTLGNVAKNVAIRGKKYTVAAIDKSIKGNETLRKITKPTVAKKRTLKLQDTIDRKISDFKMPKTTKSQKPINQTQGFKSELDWSPESWFGTRVGGQYDAEDVAALKSHLPEYLEIERKAKADGTWLKMDDGTTYQGDPRSWVQFMSNDGKKLSRQRLFHGDSDMFMDIDGKDVTPEKIGNTILWTNTNKYLPHTYGNHHYELAIPKGVANKTFDAKGRNWNDLADISDYKYRNTNDVFDDLSKDNNIVTISNVVDVGPDSRWTPGNNGIPNMLDREQLHDYYKRVFKGDNVVLGKDVPRKSLLGNNGNFDLSNKNIYKSLFPLLIGTELLQDNHNSGKDIHIKKANRGKFTEAANEHNMGVQEFARQVLSAPKGKYSSTLRKRANFARNFAH